MPPRRTVLTARSSQCRRLRIKCDEQYPRCQQCTKRHRACNLAESRFRTYDPQNETASQSPGRPDSQDDRSALLQSRRLMSKTILNDTESQFASSHSSAPDDHFPDSPSDSILGTRSSSYNGRFNEFDGVLGQSRGRLTPVSDGDQRVISNDTTRVDNDGHEGTVLGDRISPGSREPQAATPDHGIYVPPAEDTSTQRVSHQHGYDRPGTRHRPVDQVTPSSVLSASSGPDVSIRYGLEATEERAFLLRHFATTTGKW
jgi:hypothetical protein